MGTPSILPFDAPNRQQIAQGHPPDWRSPWPKDGYDTSERPTQRSLCGRGRPLRFLGRYSGLGHLRAPCCRRSAG